MTKTLLALLTTQVFATLATAVVVTLAVVLITRKALRDTLPAQRATILRALADLVRALRS